jgi:parallel beta-helix repeat protein
MKLKWLAVGIILLFMGACIIPTTAQNIEKTSLISRGNWLYVGGDGAGNYSRIQDAIDNASDGDIVYVYSGIYSGSVPAEFCCVYVSKPIHLIGENKYTTIINGTGWDGQDVVHVESGATVSGFTIQNGGTPGTLKYGRGINIQKVADVTVSDVILNHNYLGIINYWSRNILLDTITFVNHGGGISVWDAMNCTITHCVFNHAGISHNGFPPSGSGKSLYIRNNLFTNDSGIYMGYLCIASHGTTTIESNTFQNNSCALTLTNSQGINILQNNFINNTQNVLLQRVTYFYEAPFYLNYKQHWEGNYWDDWDQKGAYTLRGTWTLGILFFNIPLLKLHYREYDLHPAQEPYDNQ